MSNKFDGMKNPIFVALDLDDKEKALDIVSKTKDHVGGFKIGPRLVFRHGTEIISQAAKSAPVFLDFKFLDIPSTMDSAVRAAFEAGSTFVTVHATSGPEALKLLAKTEKELSQKRPFHIFAVTLLTSFSKETLPANYNNDSIQEQILALVEQSVECGIKSFVCSPHELKTLKNKFPQCHFITPGIRSLADSAGDQKRTATPAEALNHGASALVIGRPILQSSDPKQFILDILKSIN
ncbi:MAG: orotidine-5'-phosphate decarboxylase [Bdellovibrionota bacterium]